MLTVAWRTIRSGRGQVIGWGLALFILGLIVLPAYDLVADNVGQFNELMESYPPEVMAFFGDIQSIATPEGFLHIEFFSYMPLVVGTFALLSGSGLLASDEEAGRLDLIAAYPISRMNLYSGRVLGFLAVTALIHIFGWLAFLISLNWSALQLSAGELALPFLTLFAVTSFFGGLSILLGELLPSRKLAASVSGLVLVGSFFVTSLARINPDLESLADLSPLNYYQGGEAINGVTWSWVIALSAAAFLLIAAGAFSFQRRDIRVAGEGTWGVRLPSLRSTRSQAGAGTKQ